MDPSTLSRRHFMATAAAAGAAGFALASGVTPVTPARAADAAAPSNGGAATLRWGIIGTGTRGALTHIPVMKHAPESKLVALCDVSEDRLKSAASRAGAPVKTYSDYQKLLANPDVNAVVIASPNLYHREQFLAALQAGKHVLCEKPAGVTPADAAAIKQAADSAKTVAMFGMQYRNTARQQQIRELVSS